MIRYVSPKRNPDRKVELEVFDKMLEEMGKPFVRMFGQDEWHETEKDLRKRFEGMNYLSTRSEGWIEKATKKMTLFLNISTQRETGESPCPFAIFFCHRCAC